ncbi:MAG: ATP-binding protein [Parvularculaceae bacterium]
MAETEEKRKAADRRAARRAKRPAAPRPPTPTDIEKMLLDAARAVDEDADERTSGDPPPRLPVAPEMDATPDAAAANDGGPGSTLQPVFLALLWFGILVAGAAAAYAMALSGANVGVLLAGLIIVVAIAFIVGGALGVFSPSVAAGLALRRVAGETPQKAAQLAGVDMLANLGLVERLLDSDPEPRLVAKRDGVVVYTNKAYFDLAAAAGVAGASGLPPRIERLFSQQGDEATKIFRLCRAAACGVKADETIHQLIGLEGGGRWRRFAVSTTPLGEDVEGKAGFASWRLRELALEENEADAISAAYADYVRPVFAMEKSGVIAWTNAAMRDRLGASRGTLHSIEDVVLGETGDVVRELWRSDQTPTPALVRRADGQPLEATFRAFRRGGGGDGVAVIDMEVKSDDEAAVANVSGEVTEAPFGVAIVEGEFGRDAKIVEANRAFRDAFPAAKKNERLSACLPGGAVEDLAAELKRKAGSSSTAAPRAIDAAVGEGPAARTYALYARAMRRRRGAYGSRRAFLYSAEITDRKRMEADYAQDQKLKAIGNIAGEVAHDFNNLLQIVLTSCEELLQRHPAGDPAYADLQLIRENWQRAANLTRQLLAYSRKQTLTTKIVSLTDLLVDFSRFLDRAVGERVRLDLVNARGLPPVKVDRTQLETALVNLAVNARDAMGPAGGSVTISTRLAPAADFEERPVGNLGGRDYIVIEFADTGPGVPKDIMERIFDPFFTSKAEGKGTGLGLSTVHGVIGQMGGDITVENRPEGGACFKIYLPAEAADALAKEDDAALAGGGAAFDGAATAASGRVLVVDDEAGVRLVVNKAVKQQGYDVEVAEDGVEGLEILQGGAAFDLIITDVMMPDVDGPTLVKRARETFGLAAPVIFMSGYAEATVREQLGEAKGSFFIQKPFTKQELNAIVREAIHGRAA